MSIIIDDEFTTDDLHTIEDCDRAEALLETSIATITLQLETNYSTDERWIYNAKRALSLKRVGVRIAQRRRGHLKRQFSQDWTRQFVGLVKDHHPDIFDAVKEEISHVAQ